MGFVSPELSFDIIEPKLIQLIGFPTGIRHRAKSRILNKIKIDTIYALNRDETKFVASIPPLKSEHL